MSFLTTWSKSHPGITDIADGNLKLILGLVWLLINRFQISSDGGGGGGGPKKSAKETILAWVREYLKDYNVDLSNFPACFADGKIFNYLVHRTVSEKVDMKALPNMSNHDRLAKAFDDAESFGVPKLLSPEDVDVARPDEQSVLTYLSVFKSKVEAMDRSTAVKVVEQKKEVADDWEKWKAEMLELQKKIQAENQEKSAKLAAKEREILALEEQLKAKNKAIEDSKASDLRDKRIAELEEMIKQKTKAEAEARLAAELAENKRKKAEEDSRNDLEKLRRRIEELERDLAKMKKDNQELREQLERERKNSTLGESQANAARLKELEALRKERDAERERIQALEDAERKRKLAEDEERRKREAESKAKDERIKALEKELAEQRAAAAKSDDERFRLLKEQLEKYKAEAQKRIAELEKERADNLGTLRRFQAEMKNRGVPDLPDNKLRNDVELVVRELWFRHGRATDPDILEKQFQEDKIFESTVINMKGQLRRCIDHEKRRKINPTYPARKSDVEYEQSLEDARDDKHHLKDIRLRWVDEHNAMGELIEDKTKVEVKLDEWRQKLTKLADSPAELEAQKDNIAKELEECRKELEEDAKLYDKVQEAKRLRSDHKVAANESFDRVHANMEDRYFGEMERLEAALKGGAGVLSTSNRVVAAQRVVERLIVDAKGFFSKYSRDIRDTEIHQLVAKSINYLQQKGLTTENLLTREDYKGPVVDQIKNYAYKGYSVDLHNISDPLVVAQVLKGYFRELPEPLLTYELYPEFTDLGSRIADPSNIRKLHQLIGRLPPLRRVTLATLVLFLHRVSEQQRVNFQTPEVLAEVFTPLLLSAHSGKRH